MILFVSFLLNRLLSKKTSKPFYPPGPKEGLPLIGNLFEMRKGPLAFLEKSAREYGDIVMLGNLRAPAYLVNHPEYIKEILVNQHRNVKQGRGHQILKNLLGGGMLTSDGPEHLKQRRAIQPEFHRKNIASFAAVMVEESQKEQSQWSTRESVDMLQVMRNLTLKIVARTLFGVEWKIDISQLATASKPINDYIIKRRLNPFGSILCRLPLPATLRFRKTLMLLDQVLYRLIEAHMSKETDKGYLISMLLAQNEAEEKQNKRKAKKQIRDQAMTFFLAGHETTANALTWTCYLLAKHPQVMAKVHKELSEVLADRLPDLDDIPRLTYLEKIFKEALRLYPPVWTLSRTVLNGFKLGGYSIPKQSELITSPYITHRDPRWFEKPNDFIPERWTEEFEQALPRCAYFPFGVGPRLCIGDAFARMEAMIVLAVIAKQWRFSLQPDHVAEPDPKITLSPKGGMPMTLQHYSKPVPKAVSESALRPKKY